MNHQEQAELDWLAFQYVSDELTDEARAAFEARLMDDQAAREAVAGAVECTLAAREAFVDDAVKLAAKREAETPTSRRAWWNVALAGCALAGLVLATQAFKFVNSRTNTNAELAIAWSEARDDWSTTLPPEKSSDDEPLENELLAMQDVDVPSWMLAALSEANGESPLMNEGDEIPE
jgi:anti-sigma factor RsiW